MATRINITFTSKDSLNDILGSVIVTHSFNGNQSSYILGGTLFPSQTQFFQITQNQNAADASERTALSYGDRFNRQFSLALTGVNYQQSNMVEVNGNIVTIEVQEGEFITATSTSDYFDTSFSVENDASGVTPRVDHILTGNGDCDTIEVQVVYGQGGNAPYRVIDNRNETVINGNWDGLTTFNFDSPRGQTVSYRVVDQVDFEIGRIFITGPSKVLKTDFTHEVRNASTSSDIVVNQIVSRANTGPIEYAIQLGDSAVSPYQVSNIFGGISAPEFGDPAFIYTLYIRDVYGCVITKTIVVEGLDPTISLGDREFEVTFEISELNSLSFKRGAEAFDYEYRKNYNTALSYEEEMQLPYQAKFRFAPGQNIYTQFRSSYPFHAITLFKCDGTRSAIDHELIAQNMDVIEKVDAYIFPLEGTFTDLDGNLTSGFGVYFNGGNRYEPNTDNAFEQHNYVSVLPEWAEVGFGVDMGTLGFRQIIQTALYDEERRTPYFVVDGIIGEEAFTQVQVRFNRHDYNVYRCEFNIDEIGPGNLGYLVFEPGYTETQVDRNNLHWSESFGVLDDPSKYLRIEWYLNRNVGKAIFDERMASYLWVIGQLRPISLESNAETLQADDRRRSRDQNEELGMRMNALIMEPKVWRKLAMASALGNQGEFIVEKLNLIRTSGVTQDELGNSNRSNLEVEFAVGPDTPNTRTTDPVIDIPIGDPTDPIDLGNWRGWIHLSNLRRGLPENPAQLRNLANDTYIVFGRAQQ